VIVIACVSPLVPLALVVVIAVLVFIGATS
jgi:hypothetical protein